MFDRSAALYDLMYAFKDYRSASARLVELVHERYPTAKTLLDVGCGTGRHLEHLGRTFEVSGLDINPELLAVAGRRCPGVPFHQGDMVDFDLEERFDVVTCLFSSIAYTGTVDRMARAVATLARHLEPGGILAIEPFFPPERFWEGHVVANVAREDDRHVAWMYVQRRQDDVAVLDIHYLVGTPEGIDRFQERHELGLFRDQEIAAAFRSAGLTVEHEPEGLFGRGLFLGRRAS
jgi:SAM-dependent methyltransferase